MCPYPGLGGITAADPACVAPPAVAAIDTTKIHSIAGLLAGDKSFVATRPFRSPHHTISDIGLLAAKVPAGDEDDTMEGYHLYAGGGFGPDADIGQEVYRDVKAEDAAAVAPDTAAADAARKSALPVGSDSPTARSDSPTARDTAANNPRHGTLTAAEESTEMPKAGQVNNHSSTSLEKSSGR